jgi:hypothetical protein
MRNSDGLTQKEWLFAEEYLKDGNMERAYKVAFPNDKGRNGWRTAKRKEVICYISKRLHEKQATLNRLKDKSNNSLLKKLDDPDPEVSLEASKIIAKLEELEIKYKELEVAKETPPSVNNNPIIINVTPVDKP